MCKVYDLKWNKYKRGQVWVVQEDPDVTKALREHGSTVINGTRPYFIINTMGCQVTCIPMTTNVSREAFTENDIVFKSDDQGSRIICSQICTKSTNDFVKYMYTFDDDAVEIVMKSVAKFLGMDIFQGSPAKVSTEKADPVTNETQNKVRYCSREDTEIVNKWFERIQNRDKHSRTKVFLTDREAVAFCNKYNHVKNEDLADMLGVPVYVAKQWKTNARKAAGISYSTQGAK